MTASIIPDPNLLHVMSTDYHILWEIDRTEISTEQAESTIASIHTQIGEQTGDDIVTGQVHDFDIATSGVAATYLIGVGSALTAQAITEALKSLSGTEDVTVKTDVDAEVDGDDQEGDVNIDVEVSVNNE